MYELADDEVRQANQKDLPRVPQDTVDKADDKYEYSLWQEETIAKDGRLYEFCVV